MKKIILIDAIGSWLKKSDAIEQVVLPIGLMALATYLHQEYPGEVDTKIYNADVDFKDEEQIKELFKAEQPDIIGIRGLTRYRQLFINISKIAKSVSKALVIGGGPYISSDENYALLDSSIDIAVVGEGELTLAEIVGNLLSDQPLKGIKGTAFLENGLVSKMEDRELIQNLDELPFPDYGFVNLEKYAQFLSYGYNKRKQGVIYTSRGCPYGCVFCHNQFGLSFRERSPENVVSEINLLFETEGIRDFYIVDDNFNLHRERAMRIFKMLSSGALRGNIRLYFVNGLRGDLVDNEFIDAMVDAGTIWVSYAIETASKRLQKEIDKNLDLDKVKNAIEYSSSKGICVVYWGLLGIEGETIEEAMQTIELMEGLPYSVVPMMFALKPYPGTKAYKSLNETHRKNVNLETDYHDFRELIRKDSRYGEIIYRWERSVYSPARLEHIKMIFERNGYSDQEINDIFALLYPMPNSETEKASFEDIAIEEKYDPIISFIQEFYDEKIFDPSNGKQKAVIRNALRKTFDDICLHSSSFVHLIVRAEILYNVRFENSDFPENRRIIDYVKMIFNKIEAGAK